MAGKLVVFLLALLCGSQVFAVDTGSSSAVLNSFLISLNSASKAVFTTGGWDLTNANADYCTATLSKGAVRCTAGRITSINLNCQANGMDFSSITNDANLVTIAGLVSITKLSAITYFNIANCKIPIGSVSTLLPATTLQNLTLSGNGFTGTIPSGILGVKILDLSNGKLPSASLGGWLNFPTVAPTSPGNLQSLDVSGNAINSNLAVFTSAFSSLSYFNLANNAQGSLPSTIGSLGALTYLDMSGNGMTGNIPTELGNLKNLIYLDLSGISSGSGVVTLGGTVPTQMTALTALQTFKCLLCGSSTNVVTIGTPLYSWTALTDLEITAAAASANVNPTFGNFVAGASGFQKLSNLKKLILGSIATPFNTAPDLSAVKTKLQYLDLSNNAGLAHVTNIGVDTSYTALQTLIASSCALADDLSVAGFLGSLPALTHLDLSKNKFTNQLPASFGKFDYLDLSGGLSTNGISGTFPPEYRPTNLISPPGGANPITGGTKSGTWGTLKLAPANICPKEDYTFYATNQDAISQFCNCQPGDCQNGGVCDSLDNGNGGFPCKCDEGFFGNNCGGVCDIHCFTCIGPNNGDCTKCNNPTNNPQTSHNFHVPSSDDPTASNFTCLDCQPKENVLTDLDWCQPCQYPCDTCNVAQGGNDTCFTCVTQTPALSLFVTHQNDQSGICIVPTAPVCDGSDNGPTPGARYDFESHVCAQPPAFVVVLTAPRDKRYTASTNLHVAIYGRWGKGIGLATSTWQNNIYRKKMGGPTNTNTKTFDVGPLRSFDLGSYQTHDDLLIQTVQIYRQGYSGVDTNNHPKTIADGPVRTYSSAFENPKKPFYNLTILSGFPHFEFNNPSDPPLPTVCTGYADCYDPNATHA